MAFRRRAAASDEPPSAAALQAHALRLLGRRELSRHQLRARLLERGAEAAVIDHLLAWLTERGLLDDARVARAYARTAAQVKRRGRDRILRELAQMGIAGDVADAAADEVCGAEAEAGRLDTVLRRRARGRDLGDPAVARSLFSALVRQGFAPEDVRHALQRGRAWDAGVDED